MTTSMLPDPLSARLDSAAAHALQTRRERALGPGHLVASASGHVHVDVFRHDDRPDVGVTLVTQGASALALDTGHQHDHGVRVELMTYVPSTFPSILSETTSARATWPLRMLTRLAQFPHAHSTWLGHGHTVEGLKVAAPGSLLTHVLLSAPGLDPDLEWAVSGDSSLEHLWVIPITAAERRFKLEHGADELLLRLSDADWDVRCDPWRRCVVSGRKPLSRRGLPGRAR